MGRLPVLSGRELVKLLQKIGYEHVRTRGSHAILTKENVGGKTTIPVPLHDELAVGTLKSIIDQAGLTREEFEESVRHYL